MIGTTLYKNNIDIEEYEKTAEWCNKNNATIVDKGDYYEVVTVDNNTTTGPTMSERIAVLEDAVNTLMEGVTTTNG